jgi:hypothetical protein
MNKVSSLIAIAITSAIGATTVVAPAPAMAHHSHHCNMGMGNFRAGGLYGARMSYPTMNVGRHAHSRHFRMNRLTSFGGLSSLWRLRGRGYGGYGNNLSGWSNGAPPPGFGQLNPNAGGAAPQMVPPGWSNGAPPIMQQYGGQPGTLPPVPGGAYSNP